MVLFSFCIPKLNYVQTLWLVVHEYQFCYGLTFFPFTSLAVHIIEMLSSAIDRQYIYYANNLNGF